jgi:hypothetical protein
MVQPISGYVHHLGYKKTGGRTTPSHAHIWLGRIIIILGMINGGLGFKLAGNTRTGPVAYTIVAVIFFIAYILAILIGERRRAKRLASAPPKYEGSIDSPGPYGPQPIVYEMYNRRPEGVRF